MSSYPRGGFSLIEVLIAVAILSTATIAIGILNSNLAQQMTQTASVDQVDLFRKNLMTIMADQASWLATKKANSAGGAQPLGQMDCLYGSTDCTSDGTATGTPLPPHFFAVFDAANNLVYDATIATNGIKREGVICNNFPSPACPFRFDLKWSPVCTGACQNPMVKINGVLQFNDGTGAQIILNLPMHSIQDTQRPAI